MKYFYASGGNGSYLEATFGGDQRLLLDTVHNIIEGDEKVCDKFRNWTPEQILSEYEGKSYEEPLNPEFTKESVREYVGADS